MFFDRPLCDTIIVMHHFDCFDSFDSFDEDCCVMLSVIYRFDCFDSFDEDHCVMLPQTVKTINYCDSIT